MRDTTKQYATALYEALENASSLEQKRMCLKRFIALLRRYRDHGRTQYIIGAVERLYLTKHRIHKVSAETVSGAPTALKKELEEMLGTPVILSEHIDPTLGAGIKFFIDNETLIDASASTLLHRMFHRV